MIAYDDGVESVYTDKISSTLASTHTRIGDFTVFFTHGSKNEDVSPLKTNV